ncbi:MAG: hypothetical protein HN348_28290, partial [Proteobacteria bacterium]|nr:hypothetical protein [Pseudomonadota bacterium]
CSVFRGGFDIDAARAVVETNPSEVLFRGRRATEAVGPGVNHVLDTLQSLWEKSLVTTFDRSGSRFFRLFETIAEYASGRLTPARRTEVEQRHCDYYTAAGLKWAQEANTMGSFSSWKTLEDSRDNLWAAKSRLEEKGGSAGQVLWLTVVLEEILSRKGPTDTHEKLLEGALRMLDSDDCGPELSMRLKLAEACRLRTLGEIARARDLAEGLFFDDDYLNALVAEEQCIVCRGSDDEVQAKLLGEKAASLFERVGTDYLISRALLLRASGAYEVGKLDQARLLLQQALEHARKCGHPTLRSRVLNNLAVLERHAGDMSRSLTLIEEAIKVQGHHDSLAERAQRLNHLAARYIDLLRHDEAESALSEALTLGRQRAAHRQLTDSTCLLGRLELDRNNLQASKEHILTAIEMAGNAKREQYRAVHYLALIHWFADDLSAAIALVPQLLKYHQHNPYCLSMVAALVAGTDMACAADTLNKARNLDNKSVLDLSYTIELYAAQLDLARQRGGAKEADALAKVRDLLLKVCRHPAVDPGRTLPEVSFDVRAAASLLFKTLPTDEQFQVWAELAFDKEETLVVHHDGLWFQTRSNDRVDIARRPQLCQLLAALIRGWQAQTPLSHDDVLDILWPGEGMSFKSATNRIYKVVSLLRKRGLGKALMGGTEGYCIDP